MMLPSLLVKVDLPPANTCFLTFLFRNKENKWILIISAILLITQFTIFKILYPFANFMPDSYGYIEAAWNNYAINMWPIGYSKFLRVFSTFAQSDTPLVLFQYLLLQASILLFVFTLLYLLQPGKAVKYLLVGFFVLNPLFLVTSNYISADAIFTAISLLWMVQLLWLLHTPRPYMIWIQAVLLLFTFMIRFNALYYPFIAMGVFLASGLTRKTKLAGIGLSILFIGVFIWHSENKYHELTGVRQYAAFGGWQLASNALFAYSRVKPGNESVPDKFKTLHSIVRHHLDSLNTLKNRPDGSLGLYYLWNGPLVQYLNKIYSNDTSSRYFRKWSLVAPLYQQYGMYLIQEHPAAFVRFFILPNAIRYYMAPAEFLQEYNMMTDSVRPLAKDWFGYKSEQVKAYSKRLKICNIFPLVNGLINAAFLIGFIGLFMFDTSDLNGKLFKKIAFLCFGLWLLHAGFSILASPIVLRYQLFIMIISFSLAAVFGEYLIKTATSTPTPLTGDFDTIAIIKNHEKNFTR